MAAPTVDGRPEVAARREAAYARAARRHLRALVRVERRIARIAGARMVTFLVGAVAAFVAWYDADPRWWPLAAVGMVGFSISAWLHRRPYAVAPRLRALAGLNQEAVARLRGAWEALPDDGARYVDPRRPETVELQLVGRGSLYQLVSRAGLPAGRDRVASLLVDGVGPDALAGRQEAARELAPQVAFRHRVEAEARLVEVDDAALGRFLEWAEQPDQRKWMRGWTALGALLVPATLVQGVLSAAFDLETAWRATLLAQAVVFSLTTRRLSAQYVHLVGRNDHRPFVALRQMFARIERRRFRAPLLREMQGALGSAGDRPSERMGRVEAIIEALAVRHGALLYSALGLTLLWELFQCWRLEGWRARHGARLRADLTALADFEALSSMAAFSADHPDYAWPVVDAAGPALEGRHLAHPLFPRSGRVANDFAIEDGGRLVLVTGSNMSGKSSFLRTLGINVRLALAGAPVCADALRLRPCVPASSIQVTDAPAEGVSRFYAEVKRIRTILDAVEAGEAGAGEGALPRLYLIDEMLSGTNSRERRLASREITRRLLAARRSFGLVTTHDLDLVKPGEGDARLAMFHFSDRFDGQALHFDYKLRTGLATTTNALDVLRLEGISVPEASEGVSSGGQGTR